MVNIFPFPDPAPTAAVAAPAQDPVQEANAMIASNMQQSVLAQMQQMQAMMLQLQTNQHSSGNQHSGNGYRNNMATGVNTTPPAGRVCPPLQVPAEGNQQLHYQLSPTNIAGRMENVRT